MERSDKQKVDDYVKTLRCANHVFSTPEGQVLLQYIMFETGVFRADSGHAHREGLEGARALREFGMHVLDISVMQRGDAMPEIIKNVVLKATDTDPDDLRASVEEYLRSSGEIS